VGQFGRRFPQRLKPPLKIRWLSQRKTAAPPKGEIKIKGKNQNQRQESKLKARTKIKVLGDSGMERAGRLRTAGGSADLFAAPLRQD
jgi:hypothetical protein